MSITVRFFASLAELAGQRRCSLDGAGLATVEDVWRAALPGMAMPAGTLVAVNMEYVARGHTVSAGDEVAFMPPVTGG